MLGFVVPIASNNNNSISTGIMLFQIQDLAHSGEEDACPSGLWMPVFAPLGRQIQFFFWLVGTWELDSSIHHISGCDIPCPSIMS